MKILAMFLAAVLSAACSSEDKMPDQVEIYYVPIGVETYVPITKENIQESASRIGQIALSDRRFKKLIRLLESSSFGQFESDNLRAKILLSTDNVIYIDNNGGVQLPRAEARKLSDSSLQVVRKILEKTTSKKNS